MSFSKARFYIVATILGLSIAIGTQSIAQGNPQVHAAFQTIAKELHQTRSLLHLANHDYNGRRAAAVHQIGQAMHALHPHHKHQLPHRHLKTGGGNNELQTVSDAQLRQAIGQLQVIYNQLGQFQGHPHAVQSASHIQIAVRDLQQALMIR